MIKVNSLTVKGFMSFKEPTNFVFEKSKIYLVTGANGSGKSTLFTESLSFLFYGRPFRQMAIKNVVNDDSKLCSVKIVYNDNKVLERVRGKEGDFTILSDSKQITQEDLSAIIGLERDLFFNSVIFGQGFGGFVYFKDKDKKKFVTQLSLGFIDNYLERISTLKRSYELSIDELKRTIDRLNSNVKIKSFESVEINRSYREYEKNRTANIKGQDKLYKSLEKSLDLTTLKISHIRDTIFRKEKAVANIDSKVKLVSKEISQCESIKLVNLQMAKNLIDKKEILQNQLKVVKELNNCPTCFQKIVNADILIKEINGKLSNVNVELRIRENIREEMDKSIIEFDEKLKQIYSIQNKKIEALEFLRRNMEEHISHKSKFLSEISSVMEKIEQLKQDYNPYKKQFDDISSQIGNIKKELVEEEGKLFIQKQYSSAMDFWDGEFRAFKNSIFSSMMESLGSIANKYLGFLSNGKFTMNISSSLRRTKAAIRDKFKVDILHSGKKVDFDRLSGGERRQISLAVNAAFIQLLHRYIGGGFNFIVLDEVFENLDEYAKERVVTMLEDMQRQTGKTLLLITHDNFIVENKEGFNCIEIINKGGTSYVKQKTV